MGTTIFTGNSGFDVQKVIDGLTKIEGRRSEQLTQKTIDVTTRMSTLATLMGQAKDLEDSLKALADGVPVGVIGRKPLNVDTDVAETAPAGRYNVQVTSLAQAAQGATQTFATADTRVAAGQYNFVVDGQSFQFTLLPDATLDDLAGAITATGAPVQASLVNTGSGTTLSLVGTKTGISTGVAPTDALRLELVTPEPADAGLVPPPTVPAITINQDPTNAVVKVNGVTITRSSNTISDVIPGVTLKATNVGSVEAFEIGRDTSQVGDKVQGFVDAYNTLRRAVNNQLDVAGGTDTAQLLTNDPVVRRLGRQLNDLLRIEGGGLRSLGAIGVNITRQGTLEFNAGKLKAVALVNSSGVTDLLTGTNGFATKARDAISAFSNPLSGSLSKRTFELSDEVAKIEKEKAAADLKVEAFRERLVRQFAALQSVQSQMGGITNFLKASDAAANKG
jgi:flagellar hook-associated protein 2